MADILNNLNKQQIEAVKYIKGPSIILAGAGSGKTRVLVSKVLYLIKEKNIDSKTIIMVTFTNKAAGEMKRRVGVNLGFVGTFHSLCVRILRRNCDNIGFNHDFIIYDDDDKLQLIKVIIKSGYFKNKISPSSVEYRISSAKNNLINDDQYQTFSKSEYEKEIADIYKIYQQKLRINNAFDFDDLISKTVELFLKHPEVLDIYHNLYHYILVDEFQDTNFAQYFLTKLLGKKNKNVTVVGDFSQSIYSWRGAEIKNLTKFESDFAGTKTFYLEKNYRSTQNILNYAFDVISPNQSHPILKLYTDNHTGDEVQIIDHNNEQQEAIYIAEIGSTINNISNLNNIAVLYRINAQSRVIEEALLHYGIPYLLIGGTRFYERSEIKDILCYLRLIVNPKEEVSLKRAIKIGKKRFEKYKNYADSVKNKYLNMTSDEIIGGILKSTEYINLYDQDIDKDLARIENIKELRSVAGSYPNLNDFLAQIALVESEYSESEKLSKNKDGIRLMTLHQAKGLEFDTVFIVGLEEGLLPHSRSIYDQFELEEERRLFYVGVTRAKKKLYISYARQRYIFGRRIPTEPSRFIKTSEEIDFIAKTF